MTLLEDELMHAQFYDRAKAHEYYLRTRRLKGRRKGGEADISSRSGDHGDQGGTGGHSNAALRDSRREELERSIEQMHVKVERLRELLRIRVDKAKGRAGVKEPEKESSTTKETASKKEKASKDASKDKPLTEKQKADKRKASKEQYEKENGTSLAREAEALRGTIKDLRERLAKLPKPATNANESLRTESKRRNGR